METELRKSDLYETPPEVFDYYDMIFRFTLDACAEQATAKCRRYFTVKDNALKKDWADEGGSIWLNCPYSNPLPWVEKAKWEQAKGALIVALLPADTSTGWLQSLMYDPMITLRLPPGRIRFLYDGVRQGSPRFGNAVAIFWPCMKKGK